ncbi:MAG: hypothetical protein HYV35_06130 [Lentisphaerae bacterium]|nr:hypothetical protein [Lentisphaerota bacterium]
MTLCIAACALLLGGCTTAKVAKPQAIPAGAPGFDWIESGFGLGVQYAVPAQAAYGYETLEVYVSNLGKASVRCAAARLDGALLPWASALTQAPGTNPATVGTNAAPALPKAVAWWQCYPSATLAAGETIVVQVNFRLAVGRELSLEFADGRRLKVMIPRYRAPAKEITAITWTPDYKRLYVQYRSVGVGPQQVWVNGRLVGKWQRLRAGDVGPEALAVALPGAVIAGQPVAVRLLFEDGATRQALVRAWAGIGLDAYALNRAETNRAALGLDADSGVRLAKKYGGDVACTDAKANHDGASAAAVIAEREAAYARDAQHLLAVHYCTSMRPPLWNIYGSIADAVYANPYRFSYGGNLRKYLDEEETAMTRSWLSARPRPWLYMPEAFRKRERALEAEELRTLVWVALARGCKGLSYFAYDLPSKTGYKDLPALSRAILELNAAVRSHAAELAPLAPVSARAIETTKGNWVKLYVGWAGEKGLLAVVRNLDFEVDAKPAGADGRAFRPRVKSDVTVPITIPPWFRPALAVAWVGDNVELVKAGPGLPAIAPRATAGWQLKFARLDALGVAWLPNGAENAPPAASADKN